MISKMIGYLTLSGLLSIFPAEDCIPGTNSRVVERGENITFPIEHDTKSGKEYDVTLALNGTFIAQLTCLNVNCNVTLSKKKPGSLIVYEDGSLIIMNSSRLDMGIYKIRYKGSSLEKDKTEKCFNVTVIDYEHTSSSPSPGSTSSSPSPDNKESHSGTIAAVVTVLIICLLLLLLLLILYIRYRKVECFKQAIRDFFSFLSCNNRNPNEEQDIEMKDQFLPPG